MSAAEIVTTTVLTKTATFQDALCCPKLYTSYLPPVGTQYFCIYKLNGTNTWALGWSVAIWHLTATIDAGGATVERSPSQEFNRRELRYIGTKFSSATTLTYWPLFVRFLNSDPAAQGVFTPTKTGVGAGPNNTPTRAPVSSSYKQGNNKKMILGV